MTSTPAHAPARLEPKHFFDLLTSHGVDFYAGVPDTVLKDFLAYINDHVPSNRHVLTVDEGASAALAMGYHVATRRIPVIYTQDGGIGNLVHSLISLCDARVYAIPMLLVVGWCGQPGTNADLPHAVEGAVLTSLLTDLSIPFAMLPTDAIGARDAVATAFEQIKRSSAPYALIVRHETFAPHPLSAMEPNRFSLTREQALRLILTQVSASDALVSTTGFTRRELYALREERGEDHRRDLLVVGGMGYSSTVALGVALAQPTRTTWCIDGDGAILMHMGTLATVGSLRPARFKHVLINNGAHDSVGGQATCSFTVNFPKVAEACGYVRAWKVSAEEDVRKAIAELRALDGPGFVEVLINKGTRADLPRFAMTPVENKEAFMCFLEQEEVARE